MAKFIMRQMNGQTGLAAGKRYPHLLKLFTKTLDDVAEEAARNTTLSPQEIKAAVSQVADVIAYYCAEGHTVQIDELGSFRARLSLKEGVPEEREGDKSQRTGASVELSGYTFKPDKELVFRGNRYGKFERIAARRWRKGSAMTEQERRAALRSYLEREGCITRPDYCRLTGLLRTAALNELRRFAREEHPFIRRCGTRPHVVYMLNVDD